MHVTAMSESTAGWTLRGLPLPVAWIPGTWCCVDVQDVDLSHAWLRHEQLPRRQLLEPQFIGAGDRPSMRPGGPVASRTARLSERISTAPSWAGMTGLQPGAIRPLCRRTSDMPEADTQISDGCLFDDARFARTSLTSALRHCHFSGRLQTLRIEGSETDGHQPLLDTDLSETDITEADFVRVDLRLARLPPSGTRSHRCRRLHPPPTSRSPLAPGPWNAYSHA